MITTALLALSFTSQVQLMEPDKLESVRASAPILDDEEWNQILHDENVLWYTSEEIPQAYQRVTQNGPDGIGWSSFHDPHYNVSADEDERRTGGAGNANFELPWNMAPGGAHLAKDVTAVKGILKPEGLPVVYFREIKTLKAPGYVIPVGYIHRSRVVDWIFPQDTVFIELLYMRLQDDDVPFEVRFRRKGVEDWEVQLFRPFATAEALADALEELPGKPGNVRAAAIRQLRAPEQQTMLRLASTQRVKKAFDETEAQSELPPIDTRDVNRLIDRPFVSTIGELWKQEAIAPVNNTRKFNIVPPEYFASHVGNSAAHCMNCHESAGDHTNDFDRNRGWYGRVRGSKSDRIFTWHPVAPDGISRYGGLRSAYLRKVFLDTGYVEKYDDAKHRPPTYTRTEGRDE